MDLFQQQSSNHEKVYDDNAPSSHRPSTGPFLRLLTVRKVIRTHCGELILLNSALRYCIR